ncbi:MAG: ATP-binding cassette domain-containing protein [Desulfobulbaceae bacterium]|nr:MAG: ATP-binding cassette domain-containing protein [Desulfobulbaceae bacterium]
MNNVNLLDVSNLKVHFPIYLNGLFRKVKGYVKAVDGVSFSLDRGQTLGLVGESGSGKTTIGRAVLRALEPTEGKISFTADGTHVDLATLQGKALKQFRPNMQLIFQDPYASLNPRMTVRDIISEPLECLNSFSRKEIDERVREIAGMCRLNLEHLRRFPHAFSGGQRQRICIARALVSRPKFVVCDESVSALDVSIQAEIINLLMDLQQELHLTYLFIAHDLSVVAHISTKVAVMYVGQFAELAPTERLFFKPLHPYTRALLSAVPTINLETAFEPVKLEGDIPNPANPPQGCRFHTRCPYVSSICKEEIPQWQEWEAEHFVACHRVDELN